MAVTPRSEQKCIKYADGLDYYVANDNSNATTLSVGEAVAQVGATMPYRKMDAELSWLFVEGEFKFIRGNQVFRMNAGDCIHVQPNVGFSFENVGNATGRVVLFCLSPNPTITEQPTPANLDENGAEDGIYRRGDSYEFFPGVHRYDVTGKHTGASCYMADMFLDVGSVGIPRHYHPAHDEAMLVLEGEINYIYGDKTVTCRAGDAFLAETKVLHGARNKTNKRARMLAIHPLLDPPRIFDPPLEQ